MAKKDIAIAQKLGQVLRVGPRVPRIKNWSNLVDELKKLTRIVGYSGHYPGIDDAIAAMCHGATIIEKHFTIDQDLPGRDNKFAILPKQLLELRNYINRYTLITSKAKSGLISHEKEVRKLYTGRWSLSEKANNKKN